MAKLPLLLLMAGLPALAGCALCSADPQRSPARKKPEPRAEIKVKPAAALPLKVKPKLKVKPPVPQVMFRGGEARRGRTGALIPRKAPVIRWRHTTERAVFSSPALSTRAGGGLYVGSLDGHFYGLDQGNGGSVRWKRKLDGALFSSPALVRNGGGVLVGSDGGYLYNLAAATGAVTWKIKLGPCQDGDGKRVRGFGPSRTRCSSSSSR